MQPPVKTPRAASSFPPQGISLLLQRPFSEFVIVSTHRVCVATCCVPRFLSICDGAHRSLANKVSDQVPVELDHSVASDEAWDRRSSAAMAAALLLQVKLFGQMAYERHF